MIVQIRGSNLRELRDIRYKSKQGYMYRDTFKALVDVYVLLFTLIR